MSITEGCRVLCGYCEKEIGEQPLQEHFYRGDCAFLDATYETFSFLGTLVTAPEPIVEWMAT